MIHSIDSKVNMDRFINVASMDSRIQLIEKNVNGTFWSTSSKMQFDAYDSFVNASFNSEYFHIDIAQCELLFGNSLESLLFMTTNRTSDGHSALTFSLYDNANMTLVEEGIEFQGINGRRIYVKSETWVRPVEKTISLGLSNENIDGETATELIIVAPVHMTSVRFVGAELLIKYGPNVVSIDPNFQKVLVYNDKYSYCLDTKSPGSLHVNFGNGLITLDGGSSDFNVVISPVDATVNSRYLSKTQVDRGDGPIFISGVPIYETGITVNSQLLTLQLNNNGMMHADATASEILMKTSIQNVGLTTEHQEIRITGGVPGLVIESGDVRFEVTKLSSPMTFTYLPNFSLPEDRFENVGPYSGRYSRPPPHSPYHAPIIIAPLVIAAPGTNVPPPPPMAMLPPPIPPPPPLPPKIALPPDLMKFAADIAPPKLNTSLTNTTVKPSTTTILTTTTLPVTTTVPTTTTTMTTTTTTQKPTTTTMTTTTTMPTTTSSLPKIPKKEKPLEVHEDEEEDDDEELSEKERAKAKRRKEKMYREWESEENNVDNDGDTKTETFTYPNGTTVTRLINIRRKVTTKIVYKHRVEEDENGKNNNSTLPPFVFPDPNHLNYTKLATDCKGNDLNFNISLETSTGYHLVTFPTVGVPGGQTTSTTRLPSTDNDLITETPISSTQGITPSTNPVTEVPVTTNPDILSTETSTVTTTEASIDTTEVTSSTSTSLSPEDLSTSSLTETTTVSSASSDSTTPQESTSPGIETSTSEGSLDYSTMDPRWISTTENGNGESTTGEVLLTTEQSSTEGSIESSTVPSVDQNETATTASTDMSTDNPLLLTTSSDNLLETTTIELQSTSQEAETTLTTEEPTYASTEGNLETTTMTEPSTEANGEVSTIPTTTETYPEPSQLTTDDFVIGHWFSTEEMRTESTTDASEIGITATLGSIDVATTTIPDDGVPLPNDLNINSEPFETTTAFTTLETTTLLDIGTSVDGFPEPSYLPPTNPPPKAEKMLILKLQVPDDIDVNSSQFIKNITSSLRRLVRDVSTELKKRRKRSLTSIDTIQDDAATDVESIPIKVENITKTLNVTVVVFALQIDDEMNNGEHELENALHEVDTYNLHRYFAFEPVEKISIDPGIINEKRLLEVLVASFVALLLFLIVIFMYLKKKGILEKVFRKLDRVRCNTLSTRRPSAFSPN